MSVSVDARPMSLPAAETAALPRVLAPLLLTLVILLAALFAGRAIQPALNRPLTTLRVDGALTHLTSAEVAAATALSAQTHIFDADLPTLRARIEALPWVARARVSRVWPDTLEVRVWERVPAARWGEDALLDGDGQAFTPPARDLLPEAIQTLPKLSGPPGREAEVMHAYRGLAAALKGSDFAPAGVALDRRGEWRSTTVRGIELRFGNDDPLNHVPLLLGAIRRTLAANIEQVDYIDLRYSNGFAVSECQGHSLTADDRTSMARSGCSESIATAPGKATPTLTKQVASGSESNAAAPGKAIPAPAKQVAEQTTTAKPVKSTKPAKAKARKASVARKFRSLAIASAAAKEHSKK